MDLIQGALVRGVFGGSKECFFNNFGPFGEPLLRFEVQNFTQNWSNEAQPYFQKRIFESLTRPLFVAVGCVLHILKAYDTYKKCFPHVGDCNDIKKSDIRHSNRIICKEKTILVDF